MEIVSLFIFARFINKILKRLYYFDEDEYSTELLLKE